MTTSLFPPPPPPLLTLSPDPLEVYERMTPLVVWMRKHHVRRFVIDGIELEVDALPEPVVGVGAVVADPDSVTP